jgi:response regulator RpfG family c-di-GMP phosphodiesterase
MIAGHAEIGYEIFRESRPRILKLAATIAKEHHEKWDGSGYPRGLSGESISLAARIVALADVYDALSQSRSYKDAWPQEEVLQTIRAGRGHHFDPNVVDAFFRALPRIDEIRNRFPDSDTSTNE